MEWGLEPREEKEKQVGGKNQNKHFNHFMDFFFVF